MYHGCDEHLLNISTVENSVENPSFVIVDVISTRITLVEGYFQVFCERYLVIS